VIGRRGAATVLAACALAIAALAQAGATDLSISIGADGTLRIQGSAEVPRYPAEGRWTEVAGRSSDRWVTRHFLFLAPDQPPAMELYVSQSLRGDAPDGVFEIGLVTGFLGGFASRAGFRHETPAFDETLIARSRAKRCRVELTKGARRLWLYAYVFPRRPGLTFLTLWPRSDEAAAIEGYLGRLSLE
jgi:hypothetical protein